MASLQYNYKIYNDEYFDNLRVGNLTVNNITANNITATSGTFGTLNAQTANVETLNSDTINNTGVITTDVINANTGNFINLNTQNLSASSITLGATTITDFSQVDTGGFTAIDDAPVGSVHHYVSPQPPPGWRVADGSALSTTAFPQLFAVTAYRYGGSGTTFNLPDLRQRYARGASTAAQLGTTGGAATATLTVPNLAAHTHGLNNHTHGVGSSSTVQGSITGGQTTDPGDTTPTFGLLPVSELTDGTVPDAVNFSGATSGPTPNITETTGQGTAFSILDPFIYLTPIIKVLPGSNTAPAASPALPAV